MNISDIKPGTDLCIKLMIDSSPVPFKTIAIMPYKGGGLLVNTLVYKGEPLPDWADGSIDPFTDAQGLRHQFRVDSVLAVDKYDKVLHAIYGSELILKDANRRKAERHVINLLGKAEVRRGVYTNVIVYDISMRGISLMLGKCPVKLNRGDEIAVSFRKDANSKTLNARCRVMREFMVGNYPTVGCQLMNIEPELLTFILQTRNHKEAPQAEQSRSKVTVRQGGSSTANTDNAAGGAGPDKKQDNSITPGSQFSVSGNSHIFKI